MLHSLLLLLLALVAALDAELDVLRVVIGVFFLPLLGLLGELEVESAPEVRRGVADLTIFAAGPMITYLAMRRGGILVGMVVEVCAREPGRILRSIIARAPYISEQNAVGYVASTGMLAFAIQGCSRVLSPETLQQPTGLAKCNIVIGISLGCTVWTPWIGRNDRQASQYVRRALRGRCERREVTNGGPGDQREADEDLASQATSDECRGEQGGTINSCG